jgi:hypothetical protein
MGEAVSRPLTHDGPEMQCAVPLAPQDYLPVEPDADGSDGERRPLHNLEAALAEVEAGEVVDHEDVMAELRGLFRGRVPAETMRQLGEP